MTLEENGEFVTESSVLEVESILDRRKLLKRERRNRFWNASWRIGFTTGLAVFLGWGLSQPQWKIRSLSQINVLGNTQLSTQTLERLIPVTYPASLIRIRPQEIATQIKTYAHVEQVTISRQLFPPQVNVVVQEREPVAQLICKGCNLTYDGQPLFGSSDRWLVDGDGVVLPQHSYVNFDSQALPSLEIKGYLHPYSGDLKEPIDGKPVTTSIKQKALLQQMLPLLSSSAVPVQTLDWRDPKNLKLHTPLGTVHLADPTHDLSQLKSQLLTLDKLRSLPEKVDLKKVAFLDLSDPLYPTLELKNSSSRTPLIPPP